MFGPLTLRAQTPAHTDNGAFLNYAYIKYASQNALLTEVIDNLAHDYETTYLFMNCGPLGSSGRLAGGSAQVANVAGMLNTIKRWEDANPGRKFKVLAWFGADMIPTDADFVDVSNFLIREAIANECAKFTSATSQGSYVAGASRVFDGVLFNPEPIGGNDAVATVRFNNLKTVMDRVRARITGAKVAGFCPPKYSTTSGKSVWWWSPTYYYYMALHCDLLVAMTYNSGQSTAAGYQTWMQNQTRDILRAVSGKYWTSGHPAPTNGVKVMIGFPAYPANGTVHNTSAENTRNAAIGTTAGLAATDELSRGYFQSAAVYLTTNGSGSDGYASWDVDWNNLILYW
ncbi:MAG: hypothetical protein ABII82_06845 [Verrucomicrobiota bacterium]